MSEGVDVSKWQGGLDWGAARGGIEFMYAEHNGNATPNRIFPGQEIRY